MYVRKIFLILLFAIGQSSFAQTCCSGGVPLSNNLGLPNEGKKTVVIGVTYDYNNLNTLNAGSATLDDDSRLRITNSVLLNMNYALTDKFSIEGLFSWVNQTRTITQFGNESLTETSGIGDAVFLLKYTIDSVLGNRSVLNIGIGGKAPFGRSDLASEEGVQLTADLQPGSGAWDLIGWLSIAKNMGFRPSAALSASFTYRLTGANDSYLDNTSVYEFGNVLQGNLGYADQLFFFNTIFMPGLIFKYRKAFEDQVDTFDLPNTGGQWVFIRPELGVQLTPRLVLNARVEIPLYSEVVGTQLTPTVRFTSGLSYKFPSKQMNPLN